MAPPSRTTTPKYEKNVLPVLLHCEEHLDEPLPLVELAAIAGFSPHHFHRVFQHTTGETPKEYVRRLRLERAVYRLKASPGNLLPIALEAGFSTNETFTRAFARRFGMTPSEFRRVLRTYRENVGGTMTSHTFEGFTEETPLTLRFDMRREPVSATRIPARHLVFSRHTGYENLLADGRSFLDLWSELFAYADAHGIEYSTDTLVGITHDDPYVTADDRFRFDACLVVNGPVNAAHPFGYRYHEPGLCVVRGHSGGLEEIAKTFAHIGVEWLPVGDYRLRSAPPFEIYRCERIDGRLVQLGTDACVSIEPNKRKRSGER